ncbi:MAG: radical SAM protein [Deltaproteobacteria bacterium]|nr:radical SAM protein [Deltaproteobacteria bacterium]
MANIGYIQVVRHCNHFCGFCSNPTTPYTHDFASMATLVDDFVARDYFGVILTGGEPTLHPELPRIAAYAAGKGLHVRVITNGHRLADRSFARALADAGVALAHVSIYSVHPKVEAQLRGMDGTLPRALEALDAAHEAGIELNVNCVINRLNADHLDDNIRYLIRHHPQVRHFVWNNLDPSMGRAQVNQEQFTPRLADFELSLHRAMRLLHRSGRTFRVEKVPLCYMTDFAWASTETRKIVKAEERIVHFLDDKQTVRQTEWGHRYAEACGVCSLRSICGGLFDRGDGYDPEELAPVFIDRDAIVAAIVSDDADPSEGEVRSLEQWRARQQVPQPSRSGPVPGDGLVAVGRVTDRGRRLYEAKQRSEATKAERLGVAQELPEADE